MSGDAQPLTVGVPKETAPGERRVALVPTDIRSLKKAGFEVVVETGAGLSSGFSDACYVQQGGRIAADRASGTTSRTSRKPFVRRRARIDLIRSAGAVMLTSFILAADSVTRYDARGNHRRAIQRLPRPAAMINPARDPGHRTVLRPPRQAAQ